MLVWLSTSDGSANEDRRIGMSCGCLMVLKQVGW